MRTPFRAPATGTHHPVREARHESTSTPYDPVYVVLMAVIVTAWVLKNGYLVVSWVRDRRKAKESE